MSMGRRDRLSSEIYQRMKQLQSRLNKRNAEERRRQEKADRAKYMLWEEHQRQHAQFEKYLKQRSPSPSRRKPSLRSYATSRGERMESLDSREYEYHEYGESTAPVSAITPADIILKETTPSSISSVKSKPASAPHSETGRLSMHEESSVDQLVVDIPQVNVDQLPRAESHITSSCTITPTPRTTPASADNAKSSLDQGLEDLSTMKGEGLGAGSQDGCSQVCSPDISSPPSIPSTPSQYSEQTTLPNEIDTPVNQIENIQHPSMPSLSITRLTTSTPEIAEPSLASSSSKSAVKKKGPPKAAKKKKKLRKNPDKIMDNRKNERKKSLSKKEAQFKIKEIFNNVNSLPEEELTEEAFDVFLDTIKQLSEYVDEVDSQTFEVLDDISSGFSSRVMSIVQEDEPPTEGNKTLENEKPVLIKNIEPKLTRVEINNTKRQQAEERRMQRILVVREKQGEIIRYRKISMAELRLRRQRAIMRMRQKITDDAKERQEKERQMALMFELAALNEKEKLARLEQLRLEEEQLRKEEEEKKRLKELKVKQELNDLLERSRKKHLEDQERLKRLRECVDDEDDGNMNDDDKEIAVEKKVLQELKSNTKVAKRWKKTTKQITTRMNFDQMMKIHSWVLYRQLVRDLVTHEQQSLISDIPGFSYFVLCKYELNSAEVEELMLDI